MTNKGQFTAGSKHLVKHGKSGTSIYRIWASMLSRCKNQNSPAYPSYGGRGIKVCPRWENFELFHADMGERPRGLSLDRIDNDLGYSPDNCRWADRRTQNLNQRNRRLITAEGRTMHIVEWAEEKGLSISTIWARLSNGWPEDRAVLEPKIKNRKGVPRGERLYGAEHGVQWSDSYDEAAA